MNNNAAYDIVINKVIKVNKQLPKEAFIKMGHVFGRGYFVQFPESEFTKDRNLNSKKLYINKKTYTDIGFLINKYKKFVKNLIFQEVMEGYIDDLLFGQL